MAIRCEWCSEDLKSFYTTTETTNKIFCRPECADSYVRFEKQFQEDNKSIGDITIHEPDQDTQELINSLHV